MVENIKTKKTRELERMDEFIYRFTDFGYPGRNENKRVSYCNTIKNKMLYHFKLSKRKPQLQFLLMKSFGEIISHFEGKKLNLHMIMDWSVTSKPYAIVAKDGKVRSNS